MLPQLPDCSITRKMPIYELKILKLPIQKQMFSYFGKKCNQVLCGHPPAFVFSILLVLCLICAANCVKNSCPGETRTRVDESWQELI